jgi:chromosome segregation ATPase
MNRLNDGLSKNWHSELKLKNENFHVQSEFVQKLKELESGNVKLEVDIDGLKEEKADLLTNIVEAERQLLLWERKIQLEREIQDALDPEIGQSEIKELQKDIHRMELRLNEIRKRQEQTIFEMERAVNKRDTIQLKYTKNDDITNDKSNKENSTQIDKQIVNLRGTLAQTAKNNKDFDKKLNQLQAELEEKNSMINQTENAVVQAQESLTQRSFDINSMKVAKLMSLYEIIKLQTLYRGFDNVLAKKFKAEASAQVLRQRYDDVKEVNTGIIEVLRNVAEEIPQFSDMIQQMIDV